MGAGQPQARWYTGLAYYDEVSAFTSSYRRVDLPLRRGVDLPIVAMGGIGIVSYAMGTQLNILDIYGLADPFAAHLRPERNLGFVAPPAGHEKPLPQAWVAARLTPPGTTPPPDDFPVGTFPLIEPTTGAKFQEQVAWARAALECPEIRQLMRASDAPLTVGRFVSNVFHSFGNTRMRIPADPEEAYRKFCGSDVPAEVRAMTARLRGDAHASRRCEASAAPTRESWSIRPIRRRAREACASPTMRLHEWSRPRSNLVA